MLTHQSAMDSHGWQMLGSEACQQFRRCCVGCVNHNESCRTGLTHLLAYWAAVDFALAILPATFIWKLKLTLRKRVALCCILGLGVL